MLSISPKSRSTSLGGNVWGGETMMWRRSTVVESQLRKYCSYYKVVQTGATLGSFNSKMLLHHWCLIRLRPSIKSDTNQSIGHLSLVLVYSLQSGLMRLPNHQRVLQVSPSFFRRGSTSTLLCETHLHILHWQSPQKDIRIAVKSWM